MCREDFRSESVDAGNESRDIALALRVIHTSLPRGGVCGVMPQSSTYVRRAAKSLLARQTTGNVAITIRICAGAAACAREPSFRVLHARHTDATQISSAITQNANRARKRGPPPFCHPAVPFVFVRPSRSENRSDP